MVNNPVTDFNVAHGHMTLVKIIIFKRNGLVLVSNLVRASNHTELIARVWLQRRVTQFAFNRNGPHQHKLKGSCPSPS